MGQISCAAYHSSSGKTITATLQQFNHVAGTLGNKWNNVTGQWEASPSLANQKIALTETQNVYIGNVTDVDLETWSGLVIVRYLDGDASDAVLGIEQKYMLVGVEIDESTQIATNATSIATVDANVDAILLDTNELQTDLVDGGRVDLLIDAIVADTNELQTDWVDGGRLDLLLDTAATGGAGLTQQQVRDALKLAPTAGAPNAGSIDEHLDDILADTNILQVEWANGGRLDQLLDDIDADTEPQAIRDAMKLAPTAGTPAADSVDQHLDDIISAGGGGLTQQQVRDALKLAPTAGTPAAGSVDEHLDDILADTNELQTDIVDGGRIDLLIDAIVADTNELQTDWADGGRLDLIVDATLADTGELQTDWANGGRLDLILDAIDTDTDAQAIRDAMKLAPSAGVPAAGSLDEHLDDVLADTNELQTDWVNGGRLDLIVDAIVADTNELQTDWVDTGRLDTLLDTAAGGAGLSQQQIRDAMKLAPTGGAPAVGSIDDHLDMIEADTNEIQTDLTNDGRIDLIIDSIVADTDILQQEWANGGRLDAILDIAAAGVPSAQAIRDAMKLAPSGGAPAAGSIDAHLDDVVADTNELQTDWADAGRLDTLLDTAAGGAGLSQQQIRDAMKLAPTGGAPAAGSVDEHLDDILADTNELQTDIVDGGRVDLLIDAIIVDTGTDIPATLTTIDGKIDTIDTNVDAILVDTSTTLQADLTSILADTDILQQEWSNGGRLDNILDTAAAGGSITNISPNILSRKRTWVAPVEDDAVRARNIVTVSDGADVTLGMDFKNVLNPHTAITSVDSVTDTTGAPPLTASGLAPSQDRTQAHFTISSGLTEGNEHVIEVVVTTSDGDVFKAEGLLQVR